MNQSMSKPSKSDNEWYGLQVLSQGEANSLDWRAPTSSTVDNANTNYSKTVVNDDGWGVPTNDEPVEQSSSAENGAVELCKLLKRVGPRRFYALLDLWGIDLTDGIRTEVLRLEQCGCKLDKTEEK